MSKAKHLDGFSYQVYIINSVASEFDCVIFMSNSLLIMRVIRIAVVLFIAPIGAASCNLQPATDKSLTPSNDDRGDCSAIQAGLEYLKFQYHPDIGLISEAPAAAPNIYWLTNDNALTAYTFSQLGETELSHNLIESISNYGRNTNGMIEVIWGMEIDFPPNVPEPILVKKIDQAEIWQEAHKIGPRFNDWFEYTNLALLGAINEENKGNHQTSLEIYSETLQLFDGVGFKDKAFNAMYETYKLALALYVGCLLDAQNPFTEQMSTTLMILQNSDGGFFTHYTESNFPAGDTNTETTAIALLALHECGCFPDDNDVE